MKQYLVVKQIRIIAETREAAISGHQMGRVTSVTAHEIPSNGSTIEEQEWPIFLKPLKAFAKEGDKGAGDIIARVIGPVGGDAFKKWYKTLFGKDCGCGHRQEILNARWPLPAK